MNRAGCLAPAQDLVPPQNRPASPAFEIVLTADAPFFVVVSVSWVHCVPFDSSFSGTSSSVCQLGAVIGQAPPEQDGGSRSIARRFGVPLCAGA